MALARQEDVVSYYKKVLQPGETVRFIGKLHWMIYRHAIVLAILALLVPVALSFAPPINDGIEPLAVFVLLVLAVLSFLGTWFVRTTTEIVVTDRRIIHKVGWIGRRTQEMNISKVETVDVNQGIAGRVFGFGAVLIRGIGGSWEPLTHIASPLQLRGAIMVG
jgi:uncharacterized membrane protein YdbT with pleckstrin-like domain